MNCNTYVHLQRTIGSYIKHSKVMIASIAISQNVKKVVFQNQITFTYLSFQHETFTENSYQEF